MKHWYVVRVMLVLQMLALGSFGFAQNPGNPAQNLLPCRFFTHWPYIGPTIELLPYLPPERTRELGIKRLVFRYGEEPKPGEKGERSFVIAKEKPDTAHVFDFDRQGHLRHITSLNVWAFLLEEEDWEVNRNYKQHNDWQYGKDGRLLHHTVSWSNGTDPEIDEEYDWAYPDAQSMEKQDVLSIKTGSNGEQDYIDQDITVFSLNESGQMIKSQDIVRRKVDINEETLLKTQVFEYDSEGRLIRAREEPLGKESNFSSLAEVRYMYDEEGKLVEEQYIDVYPDRPSESISIRYEYNEAGWPIQFGNENGRYFWTWTEEGIPTSHRFPSPKDDGSFVTYRIEVEFWE